MQMFDCKGYKWISKCLFLALSSMLFENPAAAQNLNQMGFHKEAYHIDKHGFWVGNDVQREHVYDPCLGNAIATFLESEDAFTLVDFGCGLGNYSQLFISKGFSVEAYDGNPDTPFLTGGIGKVLDFGVPVDLGKQFDWVISLEVGEHLPKEFETIFIENLVRHCDKGIILSWAVVGQGGYGHFNCQNNDYVKDVMEHYGLVPDVDAENYLRAGASVSWFKNTVMVFRKL